MAIAFREAALACAALFFASSVHAAVQHAEPCVDGHAEGYPCHNIDLLGHLDLVELGTSNSGNGNDMWGWTDPDSGKEYALVGLNNGTAFVDISDPDHPLRLGNLPTHSGNSLWRDVKTYGNYAFIVSEASGHGMQVFDLTRLRNVASPPVTFTEDAWYGQFLKAHNIVINEQSGFAYAVGSREGSQQCNSGLHMIDIHDPLHPAFAGCFSADGYTHDAQCVVYDAGSAYPNREICFAANEDTLTIVDVTDKSNPVQLSRTGYSGSHYTHQGWLTEDRRHFLLDDELDEQSDGHNTRTYVWNVEDLEHPSLEFAYTGPVAAIDHNLYTHNGYAFESNYESGLRILDLSNIDNGSLSEAAFFDTYPASDSANFEGTWSNYPYYASGVVAVSDINSGLFILQPNLCSAPAAVDGVTAMANGDQRIDLAWNASATPDATYAIDRTLGGCSGGATETIASGLALPNFSDTSASGTVTYGYRVRAVAASGQCAAAASTCVEASTTGACTAPPAFAGIASAQSASTPTCTVNLDWPAAQPFCGAAADYRVYRSLDPAFTPGPASLLADSIGGLAFADASAVAATDYTYVVRAEDSGNGSEDGNLVRLTAHADGPPADGAWFSGAELGDPALGGNDPLPKKGVLLAPSHVAWEIVDDVAHSGTRSYWSSYNNQECLAIGSGPVELTAGESPMLDFWTRYGIEDRYDGGIVQISIDDGQSWQTLAPAGGYPGTIDFAGNACGFATGSGAYTGTDLTWTHPQFDLAAYAGQTVRLRWQFGTDTGVTAQGWWIDDITVTHAQVPGMCEVVSDAIFANGFDAPP